ncbi:hypothetical protein AB0J80_14485 [Actinoplanes sp. NPDC049548]|uniref:hypothetical protein n=1 Tax=Actinoplanes sp. NPDC049548 TaxID=3155152 RepID=UPI00344494C9
MPPESPSDDNASTRAVYAGSSRETTPPHQQDPNVRPEEQAMQEVRNTLQQMTAGAGRFVSVAMSVQPGGVVTSLNVDSNLPAARQAEAARRINHAVSQAAHQPQAGHGAGGSQVVAAPSPSTGNAQSAGSTRRGGRGR